MAGAAMVAMTLSPVAVVPMGSEMPAPVVRHQNTHMLGCRGAVLGGTVNGDGVDAPGARSGSLGAQPDVMVIDHFPVRAGRTIAQPVRGLVAAHAQGAGCRRTTGIAFLELDSH